MIKAVIFDIDDTLFPECEFVLSGFTAVAQYLSKKYQISFSRIITMLKADFDRGVRKKNFDLLIQKLPLPQKEIKHCIAMYRTHVPKITPYDDAIGIIRYLKSKKITLGIISDGRLATQQNKISALGIKKYFHFIIINGTSSRQKPNPISFITASKKLKLRPEEVMYVADNPEKDFIGARRCGMRTVRIKRKGGLYSKVKENKKNSADATIASLRTIKRYVQRTR